MKTQTIDGKEYRLSGGLNPFQLEMYVHLINWKWQHITKEPGHHRHNGQDIPYDAILPKAMIDDLRVVYPDVVGELRSHREKYPFRLHVHFNHMASSQAANVNLFLPLLRHPAANAILRTIKPDLKRVATELLDKGYRIEFWDDPYGNLGDKTDMSGTDADIAIAYYNDADELCLWLIEHKLTEREFTECGGFRSKNRKDHHDCSRSFTEILRNPSLCYYHDVRHFKYWTITNVEQSFFVNHDRHAHCPFQGGMNQLWRNQLLALSIEKDDRQHYKHVSFSVVKHPRNTSLDATIAVYKDLIKNNEHFFNFTSANVITAAETLGDPELQRWTAWYRGLYKL